jgi:hypothetical protein
MSNSTRQLHSAIAEGKIRLYESSTDETPVPHNRYLIRREYKAGYR